MDFWKEISNRLASSEPAKAVGLSGLKINNHVHTPWSYSSFSTVDKLIEQAVEENIAVLGINDFNTTAAYPEMADKCLLNRIFPLFNIEMIGLDHNNMKAGQRINDPGNPGRTYISGKGLAFPESLSDINIQKLAEIRVKSNDHIRSMTIKVNHLLSTIDEVLTIDFDTMQKDFSLGMVRERHLAAMIRDVIILSSKDATRRDAIFTKLLGKQYREINNGDKAQLENLIRSKMLKAGGSAFVPEDPEIFIDPSEIRDIILDAGGIPTYPFLADFNNGEYTDFERYREESAKKLIKEGFYSVEFIPARNEYSKFKEYAKFLYEYGFIVSFGTEHNSPGEAPLEVFGGGGTVLDDELLEMNSEAAAIIAAHQYKMYHEGQGYLSESGRPKMEEKDEFIEFGRKLIRLVTGFELPSNATTAG